jgi:hypothetical protein
MSNGQIAKKIRYTYIYPPALIAWISHSVGENNVSPKSLDNLIDFLQQSVQCRTKWSTWYTKYCSKATLTYPLYSVVIKCGIDCTTPTLKTIINLCLPNWSWILGKWCRWRLSLPWSSQYKPTYIWSICQQSEIICAFTNVKGLTSCKSFASFVSTLIFYSYVWVPIHYVIIIYLDQTIFFPQLPSQTQVVMSPEFVCVTLLTEIVCVTHLVEHVCVTTTKVTHIKLLLAYTHIF